MGQQQGKERTSGGGGGTGALALGGSSTAGGSSSIVSGGGGGAAGGLSGATVDRHVGSSIRSKGNKPRAATVSAASTATGKERGILGSNIFTEHNGKSG